MVLPSSDRTPTPLPDRDDEEEEEGRGGEEPGSKATPLSSGVGGRGIEVAIPPGRLHGDTH